MTIIPILRLGDILLTSIQVDLTDSDALAFQSRLLGEVEKTDALGVVIDITAMEVIDSYMARILNETVAMVELLGAKAVVTGMQPMIALTLVEMGRELLGIETALDLDQGYRKLLRLIGQPGISSA